MLCDDLEVGWGVGKEGGSRRRGCIYTYIYICVCVCVCVYIYIYSPLTQVAAGQKPTQHCKAVAP